MIKFKFNKLNFRLDERFNGLLTRKSYIGCNMNVVKSKKQSMTSVRRYSTSRQTPTHASVELHENETLDGKNCKAEELLCQDQRHIGENMTGEKKTLPRLQVSMCPRIEIHLPSESPILRRLPKFTKEDKA